MNQRRLQLQQEACHGRGNAPPSRGLHFTALGGTPTAKEDAFVKFCEAVPQFKRQMDAYRKAGATGLF